MLNFFLMVQQAFFIKNFHSQRPYPLPKLLNVLSVIRVFRDCKTITQNCRSDFSNVHLLILSLLGIMREHLQTLAHIQCPRIFHHFGEREYKLLDSTRPCFTFKKAQSFTGCSLPLWPLSSTGCDSSQSRPHLVLLTCLFLLLSALGLALYCTHRRRPHRACEELQAALAVYLLRFKQILWGCWIWLTMQWP